MDSEERLAVFLDYENLAIGARDLGVEAFDFRPIADALAARGRVVVRRAYADWSFFDADRRALTHQHVELIEMPQHLGASRKNAADIKMVVDAVEMAFERNYISTFVVCTGDSDFSPLVHKLRELNKRVIGVGVQNSTSRLLPAACDEFLFYERLEGVDVPEGGERGGRKGRGRRATRPAQDVPDSPDSGAEAASEQTSQSADRNGGRSEGADQDGNGQASPEQPLEIRIAQTLADLASSASGAVTASVLKRTLLRKDPTFSESDYGFRTFGECLRHLAERGLVELSAGPATGDPEVALPDRGEPEKVFAAVRQLVQDSGGPVPLSGFKDQLRKQRPDFSEKALGYRNFLQFAKAAQAGGFVQLNWDTDVEDYLLTAS